MFQQPVDGAHTLIHWSIDQSQRFVSTPKINRDVIHELVNHPLRSFSSNDKKKNDAHLHSPPHEQELGVQPINGTHSLIHWWIDQTSRLVSTTEIIRDMIHELEKTSSAILLFARTSMTLIFIFPMNRNLQNNQLTGPIPSSIGGMTNLESL